MPAKSLAMRLCRWGGAAWPNAGESGRFFPRRRIDKEGPAPHKGRDNSWEKTCRFRLSPAFSRTRSHDSKSAPLFPCWIAALAGSAGIGQSPVITPRWSRCSLRLTAPSSEDAKAKQNLPRSERCIRTGKGRSPFGCLAGGVGWTDETGCAGRRIASRESSATLSKQPDHEDVHGRRRGTRSIPGRRILNSTMPSTPCHFQ